MSAQGQAEQKEQCTGGRAVLEPPRASPACPQCQAGVALGTLPSPCCPSRCHGNAENNEQPEPSRDAPGANVASTALLMCNLIPPSCRHTTVLQSREKGKQRGCVLKDQESVTGHSKYTDHG